MARFCGEIGFGETVETPPGSGVYVDSIVEHKFFGDIVRATRRLQDGQYLNNDLTVSNAISVVANAYAQQNIFAIRYVRWLGKLWKVSEVDIEAPRLILRLGDFYNGPTPI